MNLTTENRFWSKVDIKNDNECWNWKATKDANGYGRYWLNNKNNHAHRISWIFTHGPVPENISVCHSCDNPACCNPNHLWLGTHADNMQDKTNKGRVQSGEAHPNSKLTKEEVLEIRHRFSTEQISKSELARQYGVSGVEIYHLISKTLWKNI